MYRVASVTPRGRSPTTIASFTVVVGPNNAGKSQTLRDITLCASGQNEQAKVLEDVGIDLGPSAITFLRNLVTRMGPNEAGQHYLDGAGISLNDMSSIQYDVSQLTYFTQSEDAARTHIAAAFARELLAYLTTEARLTFSKHHTNLYRPNQRGVARLVEALHQGSNTDEDWLSERTRQAFGLAIALDYFSNRGALEVRVAESFADLKREDRAQARAFMQRCARLDEQGDGLRSFVATLGAAKVLSWEVILIDEPEAFLHPPQAFQMGRPLSEGDFGGKQVICATHSADFLRGVLFARRDITVILVSRGRKGQLVTVLSPEELQAVARDPVLSSSRVLDGIFYRQVAITGSDGDAVLYGALSARSDRSGETHYVNSYSKQATATVSTPYRHMGVPHAAIVDIDLIRVSPEFSKVAQAFLEHVGEAERLAADVRPCVEATPAADLVADAVRQLEALSAQMVELVLPGPEKELEWLRARLNEIRAEANSWSKLKRSGIRSDLLDFQARTALERLIGVCAAAGLFLVPAGERESWLEPEVPYSKNKAAYTMKALEHAASGKLADNAPLSVFIRGVHAYLEVQ